MKYKINEITPKAMCGFVGCPSIYEGLKDLTPEEMCMAGACYSVYASTKDWNEVYLIIGKVIRPSEAGLEKKVGEGETLIEVPRALIDNKRK